MLLRLMQLLLSEGERFQISVHVVPNTMLLTRY